MTHLTLINSDRPAIVDDDIYELVKDKRWRLIKVSNGAFYVGWKTHKARKDVTVYLHRLVMGDPKGKMVDHKNGDTFDNRRENLRVTTNSQNQMNRKKSKRTYKGVFPYRDGRHKVQLGKDGIDYFIGYFENERHAALAYDLNAYALFGEFASFNFVNALRG